MSAIENLRAFISDCINTSPVDHVVTKNAAEELVDHIMAKIADAKLEVAGYTIQQNGDWVEYAGPELIVHLLRQQVGLLRGRLEAELERQGRTKIGGTVNVIVTAEVLTWPLGEEEKP